MFERLNISDSNAHVDINYIRNIDYESIITNNGLVIFNWIVWAVLGQAVVIFGVASNIINITCFIKQGFKDSINVSLTGLAVSDLGCLLPLIWTNLCFTPAFGALNLPFDVGEVQYMTGAVTHAMFARISSCVTAMITVERCMCVTMPLKVKDIATTRKTRVIVIAIFIVLIGSVCPQYFIYRLGVKFYPERNKTLTGITYTGDRTTFEQFSYPINYVFIPFIAFAVISVCTALLVTELNNKAKWRIKSTSGDEASRLTSANKKVAKMVVMISALFISCFVPISVSCIAIIAVPGFSIDGEHRNIMAVIGGLGFLLESINSSVNIIIYYHMSSKFRDVLHQICFPSSSLSSCTFWCRRAV